jgi:hypothetical protein
VAIVAALNLALILAKLSVHGGNPSEFAAIGHDFAVPTELPAGYVTRAGAGADGQFYLRLTLSPLTQDASSYGITLDNPPYRQQRIMLPLLAWLLSAGGSPALAPIALIVINAIGLCFLAWLGAALMRRLGRAPAWGLALPLYAAFEISVVRDLTEILAICCLASAVLALISRRFVLATLCLCGATLARETTVLFVASLLLFTLVVRFRTKPGWTGELPFYVSSVPLVLFAVWQAFLWQRWGQMPLLAGRQNFAAPLSGALEFAALLGGLPASPLAWIHLFEVLNWLVVSAAILLCLGKSRVAPYTKLAWVGYSVLALLLSHAVWQSDWHILRALVEWHLFGLLILAAAPYRWQMLALLTGVPVWLVTMVLTLGD